MADDFSVMIKIEEGDSIDIPSILATNSEATATNTTKFEDNENVDIKPDLTSLQAGPVKDEVGSSYISYEDACLQLLGTEESNETKTSAPDDSVETEEPKSAFKADDELVGACKFYKCMMCAKDSREFSVESYERIHYHLELEHEMSTLKLRENLIECDHDETDIHCRECGEKFVNSRLLYQHINEHRAQRQSSTIHTPICLVCNYYCASVHGLHQHVLKTHFIDKAKDRVQFISAKFITASDKRADEITDYLHRTCRHCGKCCSTEKTLRLHMLRTHSDIVKTTDIDKKISCVECLNSFYSPAALTKHVRTKHMMNRGHYICWVCFDKLPAAGSDELREHYKTHRVALGSDWEPRAKRIRIDGKT